MNTIAQRVSALSEEKRLQLAQRINTRKRSSIMPAGPSQTGIFPLSFAQQRLWVIHQTRPDGAEYNLPAAVRIRGPLDVDALAKSFSQLIDRHSALRTTFTLVDDEPMQMVAASAGFSLGVTDVAGVEPGTLETLIQNEAAAPFDLASGPLFRAQMLRRSDHDHLLLLNMHHIVSDSWSAGILVKELTTLYVAFSRGQQPALNDIPIRYTDYSNWQNGQLEKEHLVSELQYWRERLKGELPVLNLPSDRPSPAVPTNCGALLSASLPTPLTSAARELSRAEGTTLFTTLLATLKVLLSRYSGQSDIIVGSPVSGRNLSETHGVIGCFVNTLALRTDCGGNPTFRELIRRVKETCLGAFAHQEVPFEKVVETVHAKRDAGHNPIFRAAFGLRREPVIDHQLGDTRFELLDIHTGTTKFDLMMEAIELDTRIRLAIEFSTDLFDRQTIERMLGHFQTLLESGTKNPDQPISQLAMLTAGEFDQIQAWNETRVEYPELNCCLHELIAAQVERTPDHPALIFDDQQLTYRQLDDRAAELAQRLRRLGVGPNTPVGVFMLRSVELVVALLGVLKAEGAYVPIDPDYPPDRIRFMLADSEAPVLITQCALVDALPANNARVLLIDGTVFESESEPIKTGTEVPSGPGDLAYIIYTSGSTGPPKGAMNAHRGIVNRLLWMQDAFRLNESDRVLQKTPFSFDVSVWEFFWPLMTGATLVVALPGGHRDSAYLARLITEHAITTLHFVPSMLQVFLDEPELAKCSTLKRVICSGEALPHDLQKRFFERCSAELHNLYGPTEAAVDVTFWKCQRGGALRTVPIGHPIANTQIHILDSHLQPVPIGVPGELIIGGLGVGLGYVRRPELTAEKFIADPFRGGDSKMYRTGDLARYLSDGAIEYLGRLDHQVKIRGFRIELGEIEAIITQNPAIRECVVLAIGEASGEKRLVAYCVQSGNTVISATELQTHIQQHLPEYMAPHTFVFLDALPLSPNGKVDRRALPEPEAPERHGKFVAPRTPEEEIIAKIWAQCLHLDRLGIHDGFFELGGNSLRATQVISRIQNALQTKIPVRAIFETPTVAGLAAHVSALRNNIGTVNEPKLVPQSRDAHIPLSAGQQRLWLLDQINPEIPLYNIPVAIRLTGHLDLSAVEQSLNQIVMRHEALRTVFPTKEGSPLQVITDRGLGILPIVDLTPAQDLHRSGQVRQLALAEVKLPFDLASGPLFRATLVRLAENEHILLLTMHHIVADGWSIELLVSELMELYRSVTAGSSPVLPPLAIQYADYSIWQKQWFQTGSVQPQLEYWRRQLDGIQVLNLPGDRPRPRVPSFAGGRRSVALPSSLLQAIETLSRREGATTFMTLMAAFQALLFRYTGQTDIAVGSPIAGRNRSEVEGLIGFFVNTLVLRTDLSGDPSFRDLLGRVRDVCLSAHANQDLPFESLVEDLRPDRNNLINPLFQVMFSVKNGARQTEQIPGLSMEIMEPPTGIAKFDLTCEFDLSPADPKVSIEFSSDLFDAPTIDRMLLHYREILTGISDTNVTVSRLPLLTGPEQRQILVDWNSTTTEFPRDASLAKLFEAQVKQAPDAPAVVFSDFEWSYSQLNRRANQVAHRLRSLGVARNTRVALFVERSAAMIAATLGILKAGGAYVPLDLSYPRERLLFMAADSAVPVLLTQRGLMDRLSEALPGVHTLCLEDIWEHAAESDDVPVAAATAGDDPAYVMYTSGSTGRPKGIEIPQRAMVRLVRNTNYIRLDSSERIAQASNISFDASTFEIWGALLNGGCLVGISKNVVLSPVEFAAELRRREITSLFLTTALFNQVAKECPSAFATLRNVMFGGEAVSPRYVRQILNSGPPKRLLHVYGPTESTTFATWHLVEDVPEGAPTVPIGHSVSNTTLYVLDANRQPVPVGVSGELYIGGDGLALGYLNQPVLTAEKFPSDPFHKDEGAKFYRTGDLVRRLPDGSIEFLGRLDQQVKIRGFRIELNEIEAVLAEHETVRECVVVDWQTSEGDKRLAAYIAPRSNCQLDNDQLRTHLKQRLPDFMIPSAFVPVAALPVTPNGKVDRKALPPPDESRPEMGTGFVEPRTPLEEAVTSIWSEVLGIEKIGVNDNFFSLGGHSLLATQIVSRVRNSLGCDLSLRYLFEAPTIAEFCASIEKQTAHRVAAEIISRADRQSALPLSYAQRRLWFLDQLIPGSALYNVPGFVRVRGRLNIQAVERSLGAIVERHEALRTTFTTVDGAPVQTIQVQSNVSLSYVDLSSLIDAQRASDLRSLASDEARRPFDLTCGPLLRVTLVRLFEEEHVLLLTMHHIVCDGWSISVFLREFAACYEAFVRGESPALPPLSIQYADFASWQRDQARESEFASELGYWKRSLGEELPVLQLPTDRPRPVTPTFRGSRETVVLPDEIRVALQSVGQQHNATLFMTILAAFNILLSRYSGQDCIVVGSPIAARNLTQLEPLIGFFVNFLVFQTDLSGNPPFIDHLNRVRETTLEAYAHQSLPFELLVDALEPGRDTGRNPLFQAAFVLQNSPQPDLKLGGLSMTVEEIDTETAKFDLTLVAREEHDGLYLSLEYAADLFDAVTIQRMLGHLENLLRGIATNPDCQLSQLPLLSASEREQQLVVWNQTRTAFPSESCAHELFEAQAARTPAAPALVFADQVVCYDELNRRANQLAHRLRRLGVGPEVLTAVAVERGPQMIVAILAILKAGGAYLPLALENPAERLAFVLQDAGPQVIVTERHLQSRWTGFPGQVLSLDDEAGALAQESTANPANTATAGNLAYVIYTSGSTGRPKGVLLEHRGLCNLAAAQRKLFAVQPGDRVLQFASLSFDASVSEVFVTLLSGATLCLASREALLPGPDLLRFLIDQRITVATLPPSVLAALPDHPLPRLRTLASAGEACVPELVARWAPGRRLLNAYGPTEATVCATAAECHSTHERPPIGRPIDNTRIYLVDAEGQPVPVGVPGEIWIGGVGVARGYLNRPELTAERFFTDPFTAQGRLYKTGDRGRFRPDGTLEYLGRFDHQVKLRGFRIELGEVEAVLRQHASVRDAVVVDREDGGGPRRLVAYVVAWGGAGETAGELRRHLSEKLPDYMVPAAFVWLDQLPLNPHGKVDRGALPPPLLNRPALDCTKEAPRNSVEKTLADIWSAVLGVENIRVHDNFFELGGDSILTIQIVARANNAGIRITPSQLFGNQTISSLADVAETSIAVLTEQGLVTGPVRLMPIQHWFFEQDLIESHHWNQAVLLELREPVDPQILSKAFQALTLHHDALRLMFHRRGVRWEQQIDEPIEASCFRLVSLASLPKNSRHAAMKEEIERAQSAFDLGKPPLIQALQFDLGASESARLLIVIHHLAVDGVSWRILLEDLHNAYSQLVKAQPLQLPLKTTSYKAWSDRLQTYAQTEEVTKDLDYWLTESRKHVSPIPVDFNSDRKCNVRYSAVTTSVSLNAKETGMLLHEVPKAYRTQMNDVLLAALSQSFSRWTGNSHLLVDLEMHGRESVFEGVDLSRTVGWFTTVAPVLLELPAKSSSDPAEALKAIKEQLRRLPRHGFGYGLLRYLNDSAGVRDPLMNLPAAEVSFNYLGQFSQSFSEASWFAVAPDAVGSELSPKGSRRHLIEFNSRVINNQLEVSCTYGRDFHGPETIDALLSDFLQALLAIIDHCSSGEAEGATPSDFPLAQLDRKRLSKLMQLLNGKEQRHLEEGQEGKDSFNKLTKVTHSNEER